MKITNLATNATLNAKIDKVKNEIPSINNFAVTAALTSIENGTPNVNDQNKKADYNAKLSETKKNILLLLNNKFTNNILDAKITEKKLANESGSDDNMKTPATKGEVNTLVIKAELKADQDKIVKLETHEFKIKYRR